MGPALAQPGVIDKIRTNLLFGHGVICVQYSIPADTDRARQLFTATFYCSQTALPHSLSCASGLLPPSLAPVVAPLSRTLVSLCCLAVSLSLGCRLLHPRDLQSHYADSFRLRCEAFFHLAGFTAALPSIGRRLLLTALPAFPRDSLHFPPFGSLPFQSRPLLSVPPRLSHMAS